MAQTTQIVPKFSFPHVETYMNDYTQVADEKGTENTPAVIQIYAVSSSKGIDNVWIRKTSRDDAIKAYGDSDFKVYGQPLMQAYRVLENSEAAVWFMRVMPENATYANSEVSVYYKEDTPAITGNFEDAHKRKFRIKFGSDSVENISVSKDIKKAMLDPKYKTKDAENYEQLPLFTVNYVGRGKCGNKYSMRITPNMAYEKEYGVKMYNYEVLTSEKGLAVDTYYVGSFVTSDKYAGAGSTLIEDIVDDANVGTVPISIKVTEESVDTLYKAYITFIKKAHEDAKKDYAKKVVEYAIPEDQMNGTVALDTQYEDKYKTLMEISEFIENTEETELPAVDEFDFIFGNVVSKPDKKIPGLFFPRALTPSVNQTAPEYKAENYTSSTNFVDFTSVTGVVLKNGTDGYFDDPRTAVYPGEKKPRKWTLAEEQEYCYKKAYDGSYDTKILSSRRMNVTAFFDANYSYPVKQKIYDIAKLRNNGRVFLDTGIIESLSGADLGILNKDYVKAFNDHMVSIDMQNFVAREYSTRKKFTVTMTYLLADLYVRHVVDNGIHIPFVKDNCQLYGHIRESLQPIVEVYNDSVKEYLNENRLNYFECIDENVYQRATQNTSQKILSDITEESNSAIYYRFKRELENDANSQIYNFADESVRKDFVEVENAKFAPWVGEVIKDFSLTFATSKYEFEHSIFHLYAGITFRGLNKQIIIEIDLNKRQYEGGGSES